MGDLEDELTGVATAVSVFDADDENVPVADDDDDEEEEEEEEEAVGVAVFDIFACTGATAGGAFLICELVLSTSAAAAFALEVTAAG